MRRFMTSIAAIAVFAAPALAQNGNGNDKGNSGGKDRPERSEKARGGEKGPDKAEKRGNSQKQQSREQDGQKQRGNERSVRSNSAGFERADVRVDKYADRGAKTGNGKIKDKIKDKGERYDRDDLRVDIRSGDRYGIFDTRRDTRVFDGCPPGLAKKQNGCTPPGLAKKRSFSPDFFGFNERRDGRYFYDDGFLVRLGSGGGIGGFIPLLGGALSIGNQWPDYYAPQRVPDYYENYFGLGDRNSYRYADDVIYRINPETAAITSVAALLTGNEFAIGQPAPRGYDAYNVPRSYQDRYRDGPEGNYRYSDGYVYRIDPETRLVAAAIELLI
ncbi:hypothetical protein [Altererythrobacter aquiaggeris]|uniref:hypothetical protein n=1 Tax=Aestuarierythrobacter aquiaggeris TaxID=1898396 RepID=UPI00301ABEDD